MEKVNESIVEKRAYLGKVIEAIRDRKLGIEEAIAASTIKQEELAWRLERELPFKARAFANYGVTYFEVADKKSKLVVPQVTITKVPNFDFANKVRELQSDKDVDDLIEAVVTVECFGITDAIGDHEMPADAQHGDIGFRLLNWEGTPLIGGEYATPVDNKFNKRHSKLVSFVREPIERLQSWKGIHNTVEAIAADVMREKGINF